MQPLMPRAEAIKLARLWQTIHGHVYPVRVGELAKEWSRQVAPNEPIDEVSAQELGRFEGGLFWLPNREVWAILYRPHENARGRSNFTIAHEFGHYVLHRRRQSSFQCSQSATLGEGPNIEREADDFASYLLMPNNDFRVQVASHPITLDLLAHCADRYAVSLTAAALKWLSLTTECAALITSREGMVLWWRSSDSARPAAFEHFRSGAELPPRSLALRASAAGTAHELRLGALQAAGVWLPHREVREMVIISDRYDMTISLLAWERQVRELKEEPDDDLTTRTPRL